MGPMFSDVCSPKIQVAPENAFLVLINALFLSKCSLDSTENLYQTNFGPLLKTADLFDFIVIGAGSAGSVVANRLSENRNWNILLLEAGGYPTHTSEVPALALEEQLTESDWAYETEPSSKACLGLKNRRCRLPRGKVLGGSSSINMHTYVRGHCSVYDQWEKLGNKGWNCQSATQYFKKSENVQREQYKTNSNHGVSGYLATTYTQMTSKIRSILLTGAKQAGVKIGDDEISDGMYEALLTTENGRRCSSAKAFLAKIKNSDNLFVATNSYVKKLTFNGKKIDGVIVQIGKKSLKIRVRNEVILSGGSINSPQLLQLSKIGPSDIIKKPIIKLPVGQNLYDHIRVTGVVIKLNQSASDNITELDSFKNIFKYYTEFKGPFTSTPNIINFFNTKNISDPIPNIQYDYQYFSANNTIKELNLFLDKTGFNEVSKKSLINANKQNNLLFARITLLNPKSKGSVKIRSENPNDKPFIENGFFEDEEDLNTLLDSMDFARNLLKTAEFKKYDAQFLDFDIPNCKDKLFDSKDYWKCSFKNFAVSANHLSGTCRMGPVTDKMAVVNSRLKVHGVSNLRVIDLSITPIIPRGNTNAAAIMIGEKGADLIKEDWKVDE